MGKHAGGMTQHEVARALGVSQGLIVHIEKTAYEKLRRSPEAKTLLEYMVAMSNMRDSHSIINPRKKAR